MQTIVFEDGGYRNLLPLTYTRAVFDLRCGCDKLIENIESTLGQTAAGVFVRPELTAVFAERQGRRVNQCAVGDDQLWINGRLLLRSQIDLPMNAAMWSGETLVAAHIGRDIACKLNIDVLMDNAAIARVLAGCRRMEMDATIGLMVQYPWHIVHANASELVRQIRRQPCKIAGKVCPGAHLLNEADICIGEGATIKPAVVLDAEAGPIRIGKNATIQPNVTIQGPCCIGEGCTVQPGASIRGGTTLGPVCKVGGEIEGTIFHGYSNKQHDGFLGHSYVGEWVNLGADTVNSDLKNTYGPVKVAINGVPIDSGETFVGSVIGDHSKTGINVALPTGCVIGYACNVFVSRYPPKFVPSFSWLTDDATDRNDPAKALDVARKVVARRNRKLSPAEEALFLSIAERSKRIEKA